MDFSKSCYPITVEDNVLTFTLPTKAQQTIDLDQLLGVDPNAQFVWGGKNFSKRAKVNTIKLGSDGRMLQAQLKWGGIPSSTTYTEAYFDLDKYLKYQDGKVVATGVPAAIAMPEASVASAAAELGATLSQNAQLNRATMSRVQNPQGEEVAIWHISAGVEKDDEDIFFTTWSPQATAAFLKVIQDSGRKIEVLAVEALCAKASFGVATLKGLPVPIPTYVGAEASLSLFVAKASVFDVQFGLTADVKLGVKDSSFEAELLGVGFVVGRRIGISLGLASVAVDLGRFF